jgi:hypothetical protein
VSTTRGIVLVVGSFAGTVDFDPGKGVDERTVIGDGNAFIWTFDQDGAYIGTVIFGTRSGIGQSGANPRGIALDPDENILIAGLWAGELDFDPGPDHDRHQSPKNVNVFVTKFLADGSYGWTRTFGGFGWDEATGVAADAGGNVLVTGNFRGSPDFDPTDGVDVHSAQVHPQNIFVTKLGPDGSYRWTRTLPAWDTWSRRNITVDPGGNAYVASTFEGTVDLDPTDGEDWRTANDDATSTSTGDAFVTRINADGSYGWTYTAGGARFDQASGVGVHQQVGVAMAGSFQDEVDFDPGPGTDIHTGLEPGFITALGFDGAYRWTRSFGHNGSAIVYDVTMAPDGAIIPVGRAIGTVPFDGAVDFNPGCAPEVRLIPSGPKWYINKLICVEASADADGNGFINLRDYAVLQNCFTGPAPTVCSKGCEAFDFDHTDDIDLPDLTPVVDAVTGP